MKTVNIVGGGLAGLSLGIALRKKGVPVALFEAGDYPRHKVCGEFISGAGPALLTGLGLEDILQSQGMRVAREVKFFVEGDSSRVVDLPSPAWCVSRWTLDRILANAFEEHGGHLNCRSRQTLRDRSEAWVFASGRRRGVQAHSTHVGIKFHLRHLSF